jgi:hypothetical protein
LWLAAACVAACVAVACGSDGESAEQAPGGRCNPGEQVECDCIGGGKSTQTCKPDGSGYDLCACGTAGTGGGGGSGGSTPGCQAPDCSACGECFTKCLCEGKDPGTCLTECTSGTGGSGGASGSGGAGGAGGSGGSSGFGGAGGSGGSSGFGGSGGSSGFGGSGGSSGSGGFGGFGGSGGSGGSSGFGGSGGSSGFGGSGGSGGSTAAGEVNCGGQQPSVCSAPAQKCCVWYQQFDECVDPSQDCDIDVYCDGTEDCTAGEICCAQWNGNGYTEARCQASCSTADDQYELCHEGVTQCAEAGTQCSQTSSGSLPDYLQRCKAP